MPDHARANTSLPSESSFFVSPHRLILKTCGTTLNLLGLPRILDIAKNYAHLPAVYRCFYSRKSFMFPDRQLGPHRDWKQEVEYLDSFFDNGAAYNIGRVNGDHWLLYMTGIPPVSSSQPHPHLPTDNRHPDSTIEILMSDLSPKARRPFFFGDLQPGQTPSELAMETSSQLGICDIFPASITELDAYAFQPCGYSSNALINWEHESPLTGNEPSEDPGSSSVSRCGEGYYTIHVTPEEGWSYASFECNVPLSTSSQSGKIPDLRTLVKRIVDIFEPGRITLTLFISSEDSDSSTGETAVEAAQRAFKAALTEIPSSSDNQAAPRRVYRRTDKINYEFRGYDLAFASFELR